MTEIFIWLSEHKLTFSFRNSIDLKTKEIMYSFTIFSLDRLEVIPITFNNCSLRTLERQIKNFYKIG